MPFLVLFVSFAANWTRGLCVCVSGRWGCRGLVCAAANSFDDWELVSQVDGYRQQGVAPTLSGITLQRRVQRRLRKCRRLRSGRSGAAMILHRGEYPGGR